MLEELIQRFETETGQKWTDPKNSPSVVLGLIGFVTRKMRDINPQQFGGNGTIGKNEDYAMGLYIEQHRKKTDDLGEIIANLLTQGVSPDDIKALHDELNPKD